MSKHRRHKEYAGRYDDLNEDNGYNDPNAYTGYENNNVLNKLSSILGNIDMNQITSILNVIGTFNKGENSTNLDNSKGSSIESDDSYNSDINLFDLRSQSKALNSTIINETAELQTHEGNEPYIREIKEEKE